MRGLTIRTPTHKQKYGFTRLIPGPTEGFENHPGRRISTLEGFNLGR